VNNIRLNKTTNTTVVDLLADVDFDLAKASDLVKVIQSTVLKQVKDANTEEVKIPAGKYNIRLLVVVTENNEL
jgi:hypothetical protein